MELIVNNNRHLEEFCQHYSARIGPTASATNSEIQQISRHSQTLLPSAWSLGFVGLRSSIAILDSGLDTTHIDFTGKLTNLRNFYQNAPVSWGSHGTQMASIAAAAQNSLGTVGVAPGAGIIFAQVGPGGVSNAVAGSAVNAALSWASGLNATVINMSFGSPVSAASYNSMAKVYMSPDAARYDKLGPGTDISYFQTAAARGSILVFAAGNDGRAYATFPGNYVSRTANGNLVLGGRAIVVGAVDQNNQIASFSNRAGHVCQMVSGTRCLDTVRTRDYFLVAPGVNLAAAQPNQISTVRNSTVLVSGTSVAAAYASGSIAVLKQAWPQLRPEQLVDLLLTTAKDLGAAGTDDIYGRGLIDLKRATEPVGAVTIATPKSFSGTASVAGPTLYTASLKGPITNNLRTATVLRQTQVLDDYGRNYSADLTSALLRGAAIYDTVSPFLGYSEYLPVYWRYKDLDFTARVGSQGQSIEVATTIMDYGLDYQIGSQSQHDGFLGNKGTGAFNLGSSTTNSHIFGVKIPVAQDLHLRVSYGLASTRIHNDSNSIISIENTVYSDTAQIGLVKYNMFKHEDKLAFGIGTEPRIKKGHATLSVIKDYSFQELDQDNIVANPIVANEKINLQQPISPIAYLNYNSFLNKYSRISASLAAGSHDYNFKVFLTLIP